MALTVISDMFEKAGGATLTDGGLVFAPGLLLFLDDGDNERAILSGHLEAANGGTRGDREDVFSVGEPSRGVLPEPLGHGNES